MPGDALSLPAASALRSHVLQALGRYWPSGGAILEVLPVPTVQPARIAGALRLVGVSLPAFGADAACEGRLLVPCEACSGGGDEVDWRAVDWWLAAFLLLEGWHERAWERAHGPIHSYGLRLRGWDARVWDRAWVNRIALWLRTWAAQHTGSTEHGLFGERPRAAIELTHDVDAVSKTLPIRLKQSAFLAFNALRLAGRGRVRDAAARVAHAGRFLFGAEDWWMLERVRAAEHAAGLRATFHFYADERRKGVVAWLLDPGYDVCEARVARFVRELGPSGWRVGLHQSHDAWRAAGAMRRQRERLEAVAATSVDRCRQHWLRFAWDETWAAQESAGLHRDATLMLNDRAGLRTAAAIAWKPWDARRGAAHAIVVLPTVLMDSHLYDYAPLGDVERRATLRRWLDEIVAVGGEAAVLWHPHTLTRDYGWSDGFAELLDGLREIAPCAAH
jgi:hypothetical protein